MSASLAVLRVLSDGKPHTVPQMAIATGLTVDQVMDGMSILRKTQCMRSRDLPYEITAAGERWLADREAKAIRVADRKKKAPKTTLEQREAAAKARQQRSVDARRERNEAAKAEAAALGQMTWADTKAKFVHKRVDAPAVADSIVSTAVLSQPALQMVWGAPHA